MGARRGRLTTSDQRELIIKYVSQARQAGARQQAACNIIGISAKTYQRWQRAPDLQDKRQKPRHSPTNKLSDVERQRVIAVSIQPEYVNYPPNKIVPMLADNGIYIASESTFYRVLKKERMLYHRQKSKPPRCVKKPRAHCAKAPNQIYSWDITYLPTLIKGAYLYLYMVTDIYSRKIVGWQVHHCESSELAADLMIDICWKEKISVNQVTLHSDNGSPMKGATMLATLQKLGVIPSFNRPSVSNDNPYSEALFRTLKYHTKYPAKPFADIDSAREWVNSFVTWYNTEHLHSGIKYVTPEQRHQGEDIAILQKRLTVYRTAKNNNPNRWSNKIRNWNHCNEVHLNPATSSKHTTNRKAA